MTLSDLVNGNAAASQDRRFTTVSVWNALKKESYSVPTEDGGRVAETQGQRVAH
jgi:hypothetical protein